MSRAGADPLADLPQFEDVVAAAGRLAGRVRRTPVVTSEAFDARVDRRVYFKCENLQRGGSFKLRGALNALLALAPAAGSRRVITHSSGNHGAALALAARTLELPATVVMPRNAAGVKLEAVRRAGATVELCDPGIEAREAAVARRLEGAPDWLLVHPFDDSRVIAGQGTAALELACEVPDLDLVLTPVGGGGLLGGTVLALEGALPHCRVVGTEPAAADDAYRSWRSGRRQTDGARETLADGLRGTLGLRNFELLRRLVAEVVTVSERQIIEAMRVFLEDTRLLVEPSAAVPVAALLAGGMGRPGEAIGVVISGGNVELDACPFLRASR